MTGDFFKALRLAIDLELPGGPDFLQSMHGQIKQIQALLRDAGPGPIENSPDLGGALEEIFGRAVFSDREAAERALAPIFRSEVFPHDALTQGFERLASYIMSAGIAFEIDEFPEAIERLRQIADESRRGDANAKIKADLTYWYEWLKQNVNESGEITLELVMGPDERSPITEEWSPDAQDFRLRREFLPLFLITSAIKRIPLPLEEYAEVSMPFMEGDPLGVPRPGQGGRAPGRGDGGRGDGGRRPVTPIRPVTPPETPQVPSGSVADLLYAPIAAVIDNALADELGDYELQNLSHFLIYIDRMTATDSPKEVGHRLDFWWPDFSDDEIPPFVEMLTTRSRVQQLIAESLNHGLLNRLTKIEGFAAVHENAVLAGFLSSQLQVLAELPAGLKKLEGLKALRSLIDDMRAAIETYDNTEREETVHALNLPAAVTAAMFDAGQFTVRTHEVESGALFQIKAKALKMQTEVLEGLVETIQTSLKHDIARRCDASDIVGLEQRKAWLATLQSAKRADLVAVLEGLRDSWPALTETLHAWSVLTLTDEYFAAAQNIISDAMDEVADQLAVLQKVAPLVVELYRDIDSATLAGSTTHLYQVYRKLFTVIGQGDETLAQRRDAVRRWGDDAAEIATNERVYQALDAELKPVMAYYKHFNAVAEGIEAVLKAMSEVFGNTDGIVANYGDSLKAGRFSDPDEHRKALALIATSSDRFFEFMDRLMNLTGRAGSTIHGVLQDITKWQPGDYNAAYEMHKWLQEHWSEHRQALDMVFNARLTRHAWKRWLRVEYGMYLRSIIGSTIPENHATLAVPLSRRLIDLLELEIADRMSASHFEEEWYSTRARNWAALHPDHSDVESVKPLGPVFDELLQQWHDGDPDLLSKMLKDSLGVGSMAFELLQVFGSQDRYTASFLMERLPGLKALLHATEESEPEAPGFLESHIMDFRLHDAMGEAQLSSMLPQDLILDLTNRSDETLTLGDPVVPDEIADQPGAARMACHFVLRFRHGTLPTDLGNIGLEGPSDEWDIVGRVSHPETNPEYDELLIRGPKGHEIRLGQTRRIVLTQVRGAARGTRTTRVLMMHLALHGKDGPLPAASREKLLTVVNALPNSGNAPAELPIQAGFADGNQLMNDGISDNRLVIDLTSVVENQRKPQVRFWNIGQPGAARDDDGKDFWVRSRILVSFETQDDVVKEQKAWALCSIAQAVGVNVSLEPLHPAHESRDPDLAHKAWISSFAGQGNRAEWVFTLPLDAESRDRVLPRGKALRLTLDNIRTQLGAGPCSLTITCQNFPGFPDRSYTLTVEKGRQIVRGDRVGIGRNPSVALDVAGAAVFDGSVSANGVAHATIPVGAVMAYAGCVSDEVWDPHTRTYNFPYTVPPGWLLCDGKPVPEGDEFKALRELMPDQRTPNLVGRMIVGVGHGAIGNQLELEDAETDEHVFGELASKVWIQPGERGGERKVKLNRYEIPQHEHILTGVGTDHIGFSFVKNGTLPGRFMQDYQHPDDKNVAHANMPPFLTVAYIVKY